MAKETWIILIDGRFFVARSITSDEYPDAKIFKKRIDAINEIEKHKLNEKGLVQLRMNYGYEE